MNTAKESLLIHGFANLLLIICGGGFAAISFAPIIRGDEAEQIRVGLIFLAFATIVITIGVHGTLKIRRFTKYVDLIYVEKMISLEQIAASTNRSLKFIRKDLQDMIDWGCFNHAVINKETNEIIIGEDAERWKRKEGEW